MGADALTALLAMGASYHLRWVFTSGDIHHEGRHLALALLSLPVWIALFAHYRLYRANQIVSRRQEVARLIHAVGVSVAAMAFMGFWAKLYVARGWLALTFIVGCLLFTAEREVIRRIMRAARNRGHLLRRIVIVGGNRDAVALATMLKKERSLGYQVAGFVRDPAGRADLPELAPLLGTVDQAREAVVASGAQGVIVVSAAVGTAVANRLARELPEVGIRTELTSTLWDIAEERLNVRSLGGFSMLSVEPVRRHGWQAFAKRTFDIVVASTGLILTAPALGAIAIAVKATSAGPVLFKQRRVGLHGGTFEVSKFRTMCKDAPEKQAALRALNEADGPLFKMRNDPRVTKVGRFLRRYSLDELPQLWNVLRGEMSIVGPRPALPDELSGWSPELYHRLRAKPGLTGMWQVNGRSDASFEQYSRLDLYYVDNWSLMIDLTIMAQTIPALLRKGAY